MKNCNYIWNNLPNNIKKRLPLNLKFGFNRIPTELNTILREEEVNNNSYYSQFFTPKYKISWFTLLSGVKNLCKLLECTQQTTFDLDVTSTNWGAIITAQDLQNYLEPSSELDGAVTNFSIVNNRLTCNTGIFNYLDLNSLNITTLSKLGSELTVDTIDLSNNLLNTASYINAELWANSLGNKPGRQIIFTGNPDSVSGTNLESILISKGWLVIT